MVVRKIAIGVFGVLMVAGMVFSVADYRKWRRAELENYGHGPGEIRPKLVLGELYQNDIAEVRMRYPSGWRTFTYENYRNPGGKIVKKITTPEVVRFFDPKRGGSTFNIEVAVRKGARSLMDEANLTVAGQKSKGWAVVGERKYWQAGEIPVTGLLMEKEDRMIWWGWAQKGDKLIWMNWEGDKTEVEENEGTFKGIWESTVWF